MSEKEPSQNQPLGEVVFQDLSADGSLTITVWRENKDEDFVAREFGAMGVVRVYDSHSGHLYHEERMILSPSAIFGPGPNLEESERWSNIISLFSE